MAGARAPMMPWAEVGEYSQGALELVDVVVAVVEEVVVENSAYET